MSLADFAESGHRHSSGQKDVAELQASFKNNNRLCLELLGSGVDVQIHT
jgi:hypothetical protein